ncbi:MAG: flagellar biosynthesis regulator FlaF [Beijerinckiaceae bacterium]|jgi:flagellar biosynthesis activator protein FlaF|nr:flagellar biosynthesis regulator FlaF [Beijerinckiaceae bacterium]MDO9440543.1 flagellar biosynthesis regulator FlaF [Beijerinckiaceae bacterium]
MYQVSYDEIIEDGSEEERSRERQAFDESIRLLEQAMSAGVKSSAAIQALHFTEQLWTILIEDLLNPGNALPEATRASIVSIGIWVVKEIELIRKGQSDDLEGIVSINAIIRDGLN